MSGHNYVRSTNPFDADDIDDETFLQNSRRPMNSQSSTFDSQIQSYQERRQHIEDSTLRSTQKSLSILRDSEQIGIATAEELMRQREKLERTDKQLDDINNTLRFSQKHINGIKSVFSSLKNYMSGRNNKSPATTSSSTPSTVKEATTTESGLDEHLATYDRYEEHPSTRLRGNVDYSNSNNDLSPNSAGSKSFTARLDANLTDMSSNIMRLKGLASELGQEIESQTDLIDRITDKAEVADITITRQNKEMVKILKK